jgi:hypothetical protein
VVAFCETDDLTAENARINSDKLFAAIRTLTSKMSAGERIIEPSVFTHLSRIFAAFNGLLGHVLYKLSFIAGKQFLEKQRKFKRSEEFSGIDDEFALLSRRADEIEEAISNRVSKYRLSQHKQSDYPEHKAMLVLSNEESTGVNPDDVLRQHGTGGSVALVYSDNSSDTQVKATFLGFGQTDKKPIPFLPPPPHFGDVPSVVAVDGAAAFYRRHRVISEKAAAHSLTKTSNSEAESLQDCKDEVAVSEFDDVESTARDIVRSLDVHALDSSVAFVIKGAADAAAHVLQPVLNLMQNMLQLESEWDKEGFLSSSNTLRSNPHIKNTVAKVFMRHTDDLAVARPCLVIMSYLLQNGNILGSESEAMYVPLTWIDFV